MNRPSTTSEKPSTREILQAILAEYARLRLLYRKAIRANRGRKTALRPGPKAGDALLLWEARCRVLDGRRIPRSEGNCLNSQLTKLTGIKFPFVPAKKAWQWRTRAHSAQQLQWEESWANLAEAQRIARMVIRAGSMSVRSVLQKRGVSRQRLDALMPLILAFNARLGFQPKLNRFIVLPKGSPDLAERIRYLNSSSPVSPSI